jgi:hypothetical protein
VLKIRRETPAFTRVLAGPAPHVPPGSKTPAHRLTCYKLYELEVARKKTPPHIGYRITRTRTGRQDFVAEAGASSSRAQGPFPLIGVYAVLRRGPQRLGGGVALRSKTANPQ